MILIVDDEKRYMENYMEELRLSNFDFSHQKDVDAALRFFEANLEQIDLLILDIMMPPGVSFEHEKTQNGLRTGVLFYKKVRQKAPDLPIIIFTNFVDEEAFRSFNREKNCQFYSKLSLLPFELVERIEEVLAMSKKIGKGKLR